MSRLYKKYLELKRCNKEKLYLFKAGIFYLFLEDDARFMSEKLKLKLTNLNEKVVKCGFPISNLNKYARWLDSHNLVWEIIEFNYINLNSKDIVYKNIIDNLIKIDLDNISPLEALKILSNFKKNIISIYDKN